MGVLTIGWTAWSFSPNKEKIYFKFSSDTDNMYYNKETKIRLLRIKHL